MPHSIKLRTWAIVAFACSVAPLTSVAAPPSPYAFSAPVQVKGLLKPWVAVILKCTLKDASGAIVGVGASPKLALDPFGNLNGTTSFTATPATDPAGNEKDLGKAKSYECSLRAINAQGHEEAADSIAQPGSVLVHSGAL